MRTSLLLLFLGTLFLAVPTRSSACWVRGPYDQITCGSTKTCIGHTVEISTCLDSDEGVDFCSTSFGLCCSDQFSVENPSGEPCKRTATSRPPLQMKTELPEVAELVFVPNWCAKRYEVAELAELQQAFGKVDSGQ